MFGITDATLAPHSSLLVTTGLHVLDPCTIDASKPAVERALNLRKRFEYGLGDSVSDAGVPLDGSADPEFFVHVVNHTLAADGVRATNDAGVAVLNDAGVGVERKYASRDAILRDYEVSAADFAAAKTYLDQEGTVFHREAPTVDPDGGLERTSIRGELVSYGLLRQRLVKALSNTLYDEAPTQRFGTDAGTDSTFVSDAIYALYNVKGLYQQLGAIRALLSPLAPTAAQGAGFLQATRDEIDALIGVWKVFWYSDIAEHLYQIGPAGARPGC